MNQLPSGFRELTQWLSRVSLTEGLWAGAVLVAAFIAGRLMAALLLSLLGRAAARSDWGGDDSLIKQLRAPIAWLFPVWLVRMACDLASLPPWVAGWLLHGLLVLLVIGIGWLLMRLIAALEELAVRRYDVDAKDNLQARSVFTQVRVLRNIARFGVGLLTAGAVLVTFDGVRVLGTGLLASTGVIGVVLGFAAQRSIATVIAGIHIAIAQPIRVDDVVIVEGEWGRVEEITLTYVVIRIWDLRRLVVPINYFLEKPFQNWTRVSADLIGSIELRLDYTVSLQALRGELDRILEGSELWDKRTANVQLTETGERTMLVRVLVSAADSGALWDLRCLVREGLMEFIKHNFPSALPRLRAEALADPRETE